MKTEINNECFNNKLNSLVKNELQRLSDLFELKLKEISDAGYLELRIKYYALYTTSPIYFELLKIEETYQKLKKNIPYNLLPNTFLSKIEIQTYYIHFNDLQLIKNYIISNNLKVNIKEQIEILKNQISSLKNEIECKNNALIYENELLDFLSSQAQ